MELAEMNHWWMEKEVRKDLVPEKRRAVLEKIKGDLHRRQIQIITGLRRVGKTTVFYQLIDELIKSKVSPFNILYCSFDEPELQGKRIEEILKEYSKLTEVNYKKEKIYLFLDEVQKSKNWTADVKLIYDSLPNIKILTSGSASLNILSEAKKSLGGRAIYYEVRPLSFSEFLKFKGIEFEERSSLYKEILADEFEKFLLRAFPEIVNEKDVNFIKYYIRNSVIEPIILKDIPKEFKEKESVDILLLENLVNIFLSDPGQYLRIDSIAKELGRAKTTLYNAIFYLEFSYITRRVFNFRPSIRATSRKLSKIYAYHPSLTIPYGVHAEKFEKFAENLVLFELDTKHYWREKEKEIDFLDDLTPIEVKIKEKIGKEDIRWIEYFMNKYKNLGIKESYVVTKNSEKEINSIKLIPLWKFCLYYLFSKKTKK
jgi:predicted AAA+ superfamily ATPase